MANLFRSIALSRRFPENLATDVLYYLLQRTPDLIRGQLRTQMSSLWAIPNLSLQVDRYEVQVTGAKSGGIFDLVGFQEEAKRLIIEVKFGAELTANQVTLAYLKDIENGGLLLFIVPESRCNDVIASLRPAIELISLDAQDLRDTSSLRFWEIRDESKFVAVASWGEVLSCLQRNALDGSADEPIQAQITSEIQDLSWFCERKEAMEFFEKLPAEDLARQQTAEFILSTMTLVDAVVTEAYRRKVIDSPKLETDYTGRSYGYGIRFGSIGDGIEGWFGLYFDAWRKRGHSPIWLQFCDEVAARIRSPLDAFGKMNPDDEKEWIAPISPKANVSRIEAVAGLVDNLDRIGKSLPITRDQFDGLGPST